MSNASHNQKMSNSSDRRQLDTAIEIITPENIAFQYRVAGPFRRVLAYGIDLAIRVVVMVAAAYVLRNFSWMGIGVALMMWFVLSWFYGGLFEALWNGQTPGKRLLRLRVLTIDGQPISGLQAVLRNVLREVDMLPVPLSFDSPPFFFCLVGLIATMMNARFQRLGDLAAGTMVVIEKRARLQGLVRVDGVHTPTLAALMDRIPRGYHVGRSMGHALAAYVQKRKQFSAARRAEIARHLADPLCRQLDLPKNTDPDLLLCALYQRTFVTDRTDRHVGLSREFVA